MRSQLAVLLLCSFLFVSQKCLPGEPDAELKANLERRIEVRADDVKIIDVFKEIATKSGVKLDLSNINRTKQTTTFSCDCRMPVFATRCNYCAK